VSPMASSGAALHNSDIPDIFANFASREISIQIIERALTTEIPDPSAALRRPCGRVIELAAGVQHRMMTSAAERPSSAVDITVDAGPRCPTPGTDRRP